MCVFVFSIISMTFEYSNIPIRSPINLPSLRQSKFVFLSKLALACHAVLTSRIKGHQTYNHDYFVGEELICELEFTNKYSHNSIEVKSRNKDVTAGHLPETLAAILFQLRKAWKVYEIQAKITGKSRRAPEGTWVLGGGMEIPCQYTIIEPKIHKKNCRKELRKAQL